MAINRINPTPSGATAPEIVSAGSAAGWGSVSERVEIVTSTSTWTHPEGASPTNPKKINAIIMGGGGGGGYATGTYGGGGGGSGIVRSQSLVITSSIPIIIGSGGVSSAPGGSTTFMGIPAPGGGQGASGDGLVPGGAAFNIGAGGSYNGGSGGSLGGDAGIQTNASPGQGGAPGVSFGLGPRSISSIYPQDSSIVSLASGGGGGGGGYNRFASSPGVGGSGIFGNGGSGGSSNVTGRPTPQGGPFASGSNAATTGNGYGGGGGGAGGTGPGASGSPGVVIIYY